MKKFAFTIAASLAVAVSSPANAANIVVNHVLDPAIVGPNLFQENLATPFTAGVGDTIEYNLTFTGGQSVTLVGDNILWLESLTNGGMASINTSVTWEFLGASANLVAGPIAFDQINQFVHVGSSIYPSQYRTDANAITFSGIRQVVTLLSVNLMDTDEDGTPETPSIDPREYYSIALYTDGRRVTTAVPEPATWAMMLMGFGVVGGAMRRRQKVSISFA